MSIQFVYRQMFRSVAQKPHVVYLCYKRRLFCISHTHSCSTNIINLKGKCAGIDSLALQLQRKKKRKKNLKSFLKKIWIKWIVSLCDEMAVARHFGDTWSWQTRGIADNTRMFLSTFQAWVASTRDSQRYLKKMSQEEYEPLDRRLNYKKIRWH